MAPSPLVVQPAPLSNNLSGYLLDVASQIQLPAEAMDRWMFGITWQPTPSRAMSTGAVDVCSPTDPTNPGYACEPAITQDAFWVYDAFNASALDHTPDIVDGMIGARWTQMVSSVFAKELSTAAASGGLSLSSEAHAPGMRAFGTAAVSVAQGIAILEDDLARTLYGAQGVIHMSPGLLGEAIQNAGIRFENGQHLTALGHRIVADAGYVDMIAPSGQAASASMKEWMYASGPVRYLSSTPELLGNSANEFMNLTRNTIIRWMMGYGLLQFDPDPVTAVLVDY